MGKVIKSISYRQEEILSDILTLYRLDGIDVDMTYSTGQFYKSGEVPPPRFKFDIAPQADGVTRADCRHMPLAGESCRSALFDPPFLVTSGPSLATDSGNIIARRFGWYGTERELFGFYRDSIKEAYRILAEDGILIVKCQDKIASGTQYLSHNFIINETADAGFYCEDIFILLAKSRIISPKHSNQKHARKYHSYFLVFRKADKKVRYG